MSHRNPAVLGEWGPDGTRALASEDYWRLPFKWNRLAAAEGRRHRVFSLSLGDWLEDRPELIAPRARLLATIQETPNLDWLLLTKRPEGWRDRMQEVAGFSADPAHIHGAGELASKWLFNMPPRNVWVGTSTEDQPAADLRIPLLLQIPAVVRFISAEPLLGPVDLMAFKPPGVPNWWQGNLNPASRLDWVISGGESGVGARPMIPDWPRGLRDQCRAAGIAYFMKQAGSVLAREWGCRDKNGQNPLDWPAEFRVREFPQNEHVDCAAR